MVPKFWDLQILYHSHAKLVSLPAWHIEAGSVMTLRRPSYIGPIPTFITKFINATKIAGSGMKLPEDYLMTDFCLVMYRLIVLQICQE